MKKVLTSILIFLFGTILAFLLWGYGGEWFNRHEGRPGDIVDPYIHFKFFSTLFLYFLSFVYVIFSKSKTIQIHWLLKLFFLPLTFIISLLSLLI